MDRCPTCGRVVSTYRRRLHREMIVFLCKLARAGEAQPGLYYSPRALLPNQSKASTDAVYLVHWGLIERRVEYQGDREVVKRGYYRITSAGLDFVQGLTKVPVYIEMRCGVLTGVATAHVDVATAYGSAFDFETVAGG